VLFLAIAAVIFFLFINNSSRTGDDPNRAQISDTQTPPTPTDAVTPPLVSPPTETPGPPDETALPEMPPEGSNPLREGPPQGRTPSFEMIEAGYTAFDSRVEMIEINQALSYGFDPATGEFFIMTNFVAGKDTGIFVSLTRPEAKPLYLSSYMTVERDGAVLGYMVPSAMPDEYTLLYQPRELESVSNWAQGGYTFRLYIDDAEAAVRTANFFDTVQARVLAVPIRANYSGQVVTCEGQWQNSSEWLAASFPLARIYIEYVLGPELDLSASRYDLNSMGGIRAVWEAIAALQTPNNDYTFIVGFIPKVAYNGQYMGWTYGLPATVVVEDSPSMSSVVSHEVSHCYGIGDEYPGGHLNIALNMPPFGMEGIDFFTLRPAVGDNPNVKGGYTMGARGSGSYVYPRQRAYHAASRTLLETVSSYMGWVSGAPDEAFWTTSDIYNHLFKVFAGNYSEYHRPEFWGVCPSCYADVYDPDMMCKCDNCGTLVPINLYSDDRFKCPDCGISSGITWDNCYMRCSVCDDVVFYKWAYDFNNGVYSGPAGSESPVVRAIQITGSLSDTGVFIPSPWYIYDIALRDLTARADGEYAIFFYDSGGNQVGVSYFDVNFVWQVNSLDGQEFIQTDNVPINIAAAFPDSTAKIVMTKGGAEIYSVNVSSAAPDVSFTGLSENQMLGDNVTLTWSATGQTNELYFEIWYCPAEGELYNVASNVTGRSFTADLSTFPGTNGGYFRIYATDGVITGEAVSPTIRVPFKAPIVIFDTDEILEYRITEEIWLNVDAYDLQDGWLWGAGDGSLVWSFEGREYLDSGMLWVWPYQLSPGLNTFTCTATNSAGLSSSRDFTFLIIDDESDLPDDWSRQEIINALKLGFVLPLDRLDAPVTRGEFAHLMFVLYSYVSDTPLSTDIYQGGMVTDCGENNWAQYVMVYFGIMHAEDGLFEPGRSMTQREATIGMYKTVATADPDVLPPNVVETYMINGFRSLGITEGSGPNAYQENERLTCRLLLVRLWRMYDSIFVT